MQIAESFGNSQSVPWFCLSISDFGDDYDPLTFRVGRIINLVTPVEVYTGQLKPQLPRWQGWAIAAKEKLDQLTQAAA